MKDTFRVVITDFGFPDVGFERKIVEAAGGKLEALQCKTEQEVIEAAQEADALLVQFAPITRTVIEALTRCKVIVRYGVGYDNVDVEAARGCGIIVCNIPDYCIDEVADHTFGLALALTRQILEINEQVRHGIWKNTPPRPMMASRKMSFVAIGFGRVAQAVLKRAQACGFSIATSDPYLGKQGESNLPVLNLRLNQALETADVLSLHAPLNEHTRHMINAHTLALIKPTSFLVNTARGGLVDGLALADALSLGQLAGAALDVFEQEPLPADHPLRTCPNVLLSSHVAWYSESSGLELQKMAAEEAIRALRHQPLNSRIV